MAAAAHAGSGLRAARAAFDRGVGMFFILKLLRKLYRTLSSEASPAQIALGFGFGILLGLTPRTVGFFFFLIGCLLIFRVNIPMALVGALAGKAAILAVAPATLAVGHFLLDDAAFLRPVWKATLTLPVVALLDLDQYRVMGAAAAGLAAAAILFLPLRALVVAYRVKFHERVANSKFIKWLNRIWLFRVLRWIFIGGTRVVG
ncbi:MAG: TIGR03546 family protein [Planctomycetes bacterium]|nr:TIGR03546 family protein [Planctomycetota bacterium]